MVMKAFQEKLGSAIDSIRAATGACCVSCMSKGVCLPRAIAQRAGQLILVAGLAGRQTLHASGPCTTPLLCLPPNAYTGQAETKLMDAAGQLESRAKGAMDRVEGAQSDWQSSAPAALPAMPWGGMAARPSTRPFLDPSTAARRQQQQQQQGVEMTPLLPTGPPAPPAAPQPPPPMPPPPPPSAPHPLPPMAPPPDALEARLPRRPSSAAPLRPTPLQPQGTLLRPPISTSAQGPGFLMQGQSSAPGTLSMLQMPGASQGTQLPGQRSFGQAQMLGQGGPWGQAGMQQAMGGVNPMAMPHRQEDVQVGGQ